MIVNFHKKDRTVTRKGVFSIKEGFYNPFDDEDMTDLGAKGAPMQMQDIKDLDNMERGRLTGKSIKKITTWNNNRKGKIEYKCGRMYAGIRFTAGDVVEVCPLKEMTQKDLYSKNIRDCVFPLDSEKGLYGLPLGYANCYRKDREAGKPGNIVYEYNETNNTIIFTALCDISPEEEIILTTEHADYANELRPDQFKYAEGKPEPIYRLKNIKFV